MPRSSSATPFPIHAFVTGHLAELTDLWICAWTQAMPSVDFEARRAWFVEHVVALRDKGTSIRCAFDASNGAMAGFITLEPSSGLVDQLAVTPTLWGRGVAQALLADVAKLAKGPLVLDVNADNPRAVRFYERAGFRRASEGVNPNSGLKTFRYIRDA